MKQKDRQRKQNDETEKFDRIRSLWFIDQKTTIEKRREQVQRMDFHPRSEEAEEW